MKKNTLDQWGYIKKVVVRLEGEFNKSSYTFKFLQLHKKKNR